MFFGISLRSTYNYSPGRLILAGAFLWAKPTVKGKKGCFWGLKREKEAAGQE
jgi:hypothetical protein